MAILLPLQLYAQTDDAAAISLDEYAARLAEAERELTQALDGDLAAYDAAQTELATVPGVRLADAEIVYPALLIETRDQIAEADLPAHAAAALARVQLVRRQLAASASDDSAARLALLQQILARPEFTQPESLIQRFQRWFAEFWARLFPAVGGQTARGITQVGPLVFWSIVIVGGGALIWLLSYWLQGLLGGLVGDAEARRRALDGDETPLSAQAAREQAARLAQDGSYRQAVRQLYLSALLTLDERGVIQYERSLTNREVLSQVQRQAQVESHLHPVVDTFDRVWYGEREPDRETFDLYEREIEELAAAGKEVEE
ncbi:MAG: DUF4129 domain-containing protein [Caldilineaceae bacterium]